MLTKLLSVRCQWHLSFRCWVRHAPQSQRSAASLSSTSYSSNQRQLVNYNLRVLQLSAYIVIRSQEYMSAMILHGTLIWTTCSRRQTNVYIHCAFLRNLACLSMTLLRYSAHWSDPYSSRMHPSCGLQCRSIFTTPSSQHKEKLCALCSVIWVTLRPFSEPHYNLSRSVGRTHAAIFYCNHNTKSPWNRSCTGIPFDLITVSVQDVAGRWPLN